jgi:hypothetical protein
MAHNDFRTDTDPDELLEHRGICLQHSGMAARLTGGLYLLGTILLMLGYQVFIQVPNLRLDLAKDIGKLEARVTALEKKNEDQDKDAAQLRERLTQAENLKKK